MSRAETRQDKLDRLATRVGAGEVVFFIGAGFSLDSEGNSTNLLVVRLLARLEALTEYAMESLDSKTAAIARRLRTGLRTTFSLRKSAASGSEFSNLFDNTQPAPDRPSVLSSTLSVLAQNYYQINDWACSAFDSLIDSLSLGPLPGDLVEKVNASENRLIQQYSKKARLAPMDLDFIIQLHWYCLHHPAPRPERAVAGKALFLDTLGFNSEEVMGGCPMDPELERVVCTSASRLRMRHHVLAWLAAEGLCPTLVTTNYDLLIECAYRLAGVLPLNPPNDVWPDHPNPLEAAVDMRMPLNRRYRHFTRIADATQFFAHGDAHEAAVIHKIHGCVENYRIARRSGDFERFRTLLPTIVFTFREIQNWREDSWSRDNLSTLLRTRTIVFAGYSVADPVIHDTFRTVYEEVAGHRSRMREPVPAPAAPAVRENGAAARAFFTDVEQTRSFHGLEILRSASLAAGDPSPELTVHPNLLTFFLGHEKAFPNLDELFTWLYHLTARELQHQALEAEVDRIAYQLFGKLRRKAETASIVNAFERLRSTERLQARKLDIGTDPRWCEPVRRRFRRLTSWTSGFHMALMREYQIAESFLRNPNDGFPIQAAARFPWYRPLAEHTQWAAWGAILEVAIRRAAATYVGRPRLWKHMTDDFEVADHPSPAILFRAEPRSARNTEPPLRRCLTIELATMRRLFSRDAPRRHFAALKPLVWELRPETIPWWAASDERLLPRTPPATTVWEWAAFESADWRPEHDPRHFFGASS